MANAEYTQAERPIGVVTPLGPDVLLLNSFSGTESMSQLFSYELNMTSTETIDPKELIGKAITFWVLDHESEPRYFNGIVKRFTYVNTDDLLNYYQAEVVPTLWFLTQTSNCRIFQHLSIPDILRQVTTGIKSSFNLLGAFEPWDYCVQYRETDFNFISRLMEQEGIFYFFRHANGGHEMVISNDKGAYKDVKDVEARFSAKMDDADIDNLSAWEHQYEFRSGKWTHTDYNFETPSTDLNSTITTVMPFNAQAKPEIYDYPGEYEKKPEGDRYVRIRMEEEEAAHNIVRGEGHLRSFNPGGKFKLKTHALNSEEGKGYVITSVRHSVSVGDTYISGGEEGASYTNSFLCIPDSMVFRPPRITPRPIIQGIQTARVVGPPGEEIYTDSEGFGRVKVKFHWDRLSKGDENSSCWIRVAQPWAGSGFGSFHLPRIGQEVVVQFLEGDPDRPLIVGSVYNKEQMPPVALPASKMQTGIMSRTTPGGKAVNCNKLLFDDTKGKEGLTILAEYDMSTTVNHDQTSHVKNDRKETVDGTHTETINKDTKVTIKTGAYTFDVSANTSTTTVNKAIKITSSTAEIHVTAETEIMLLCGQSKLLMKKNGDIELSGMNIAIKGTTSVKTSGTSIASEAGADHNIKGAIVVSEGSATNTVKGGMVMLNP